MPVYQYRCRECGELFESLRDISADDKEVECPKCGGKNPRRVPSSFVNRISVGKSGSLRFPT